MFYTFYVISYIIIMEIQYQLFQVKQLYKILSSAEQFESKLNLIRKMLQKANISHMYQLIVFLQSILTSKSQLPITKYNTLLTIMQILKKCRYQSVKFIEMYILPILKEICSFSFNIRRQQDLEMYFINKGYNNTPGMRKISGKYILLAIQIILFSAYIKPYQNVLTEQIQIPSKYLQARQELQSHKVQIPQRYRNDQLASFRNAFLQNFKNFNPTQFSNFVIKIISQQILLKKSITPSIMKFIDSIDAFITIPIINYCVEMLVKIEDMFSYKKYYIMLLTACIKYGDIYAIVIVHNNTFISEIYKEIAKIKGNQNISYGRYIFPHIQANQLQKIDFYLQFLKSLQIWATCLPTNEIGQISQVKQYFMILKQKRSFIFPEILMLDNIRDQFNQNLYKNEQRNDQLLKLIESDEQLFTKLFKKDSQSMRRDSQSSSQLKISRNRVENKHALKLIKQMNKMFHDLSHNTIDPNIKDLNEYSRQWEYMKDKIGQKSIDEKVINKGNELSQKLRLIHPLFELAKKQQITAQQFFKKMNRILNQSFTEKAIVHTKQDYDDYGINRTNQKNKNIIKSKKNFKIKDMMHQQNQTTLKLANQINEQNKQLGHESIVNILQSELLSQQKPKKYKNNNKKQLKQVDKNSKQINFLTQQTKNVTSDKRDKILINELNPRQNKYSIKNQSKLNNKYNINQEYEQSRKIVTQEKIDKLNLKNIQQSNYIKQKSLKLKKQQIIKQNKTKIKQKQKQKQKIKQQQITKQKQQQQQNKKKQQQLKQLNNIKLKKQQQKNKIKYQFQSYEVKYDYQNDYNLKNNRIDKNKNKIQKITKNTQNSIQSKQSIQQFDNSNNSLSKIILSSSILNLSNSKRNKQKHLQQFKHQLGIYDVYQIYEEPKKNSRNRNIDTNLSHNRKDNHQTKLQFNKKLYTSMSRSIQSYRSYVDSFNTSKNSLNNSETSGKSIINKQFKRLNLKSLTKKNQSQHQNVLDLFELNSSGLIESSKIQTCKQFKMDDYSKYFPAQKTSGFINNSLKLKGILLSNQDVEISFVNFKKQSNLDVILYITAKKNISALKMKIQSYQDLQIIHQNMEIRYLQANKQHIVKIQVSIKNLPYKIPLIDLKIKPKSQKSKKIQLFLPCSFNKFCLKNIQTNNRLLFRYKQNIISVKAKNINFQQKFIKKGLINILFNNYCLQNGYRIWKAQYQWQNSGFILQFTQKDIHNGGLMGISNEKDEKGLHFLLATCYYLLQI